MDQKLSDKFVFKELQQVLRILKELLRNYDEKDCLKSPSHLTWLFPVNKKSHVLSHRKYVYLELEGIL